jgi:proteasome beta subunit
MTRRIFPVVATVTADGFRRLTDEESGQYADAVVSGRMGAPDGPRALMGPTTVPNG